MMIVFQERRKSEGCVRSVSDTRNASRTKKRTRKITLLACAEESSTADGKKFQAREG